LASRRRTNVCTPLYSWHRSDSRSGLHIRNDHCGALGRGLDPALCLVPGCGGKAGPASPRGQGCAARGLGRSPGCEGHAGRARPIGIRLAATGMGDRRRRCAHKARPRAIASHVPRLRRCGRAHGATWPNRRSGVLTLPTGGHVMSESRKVHVSGSGLTRAELLRLGLVRPPLDAPTAQREPCAVCGSRAWCEAHFSAGKLLCLPCWRARARTQTPPAPQTLAGVALAQPEGARRG
jgi:hypothetical protein